MKGSSRDDLVGRLAARQVARGAVRSPGPCPDADVLAAWIDRTLPSAEREQWEHHFSSCDACREVLASLAKGEAALPVPTLARPATAAWWRWRWLVPAAATAAVAITWVVVRPSLVGPASEETLELKMARSEPTAAKEAAPAEFAAAPERGFATGTERERDQLRGARAADVARLETAPIPDREPKEKRTGAPGTEPATPPIAPAGVTRHQQEPAGTVAVAGAERAAAPPVQPSLGAAASIDKPAAPVPPRAAADERAEQLARTPPPLAEQAQGGVQPRGAVPAEQRVEKAAKADAAANEFRAKAVSQVKAEKDQPPAIIASPDPAVSWRVGPAGLVERSLDGGRTWTRQASGVSVALVAGSAPTPRVCWIVGQRGTVLLTTDGSSWRQLPAPAGADLVDVTARSALDAVVRAADGRRFATTDGGTTWRD